MMQHSPTILERLYVACLADPQAIIVMPNMICPVCLRPTTDENGTILFPSQKAATSPNDLDLFHEECVQVHANQL